MLSEIDVNGCINNKNNVLHILPVIVHCGFMYVPSRVITAQELPQCAEQQLATNVNDYINNKNKHAAITQT